MADSSLWSLVEREARCAPDAAGHVIGQFRGWKSLSFAIASKMHLLTDADKPPARDRQYLRCSPLDCQVCLIRNERSCMAMEILCKHHQFLEWRGDTILSFEKGCFPMSESETDWAIHGLKRCPYCDIVYRAVLKVKFVYIRRGVT